MIGRLVSEIFMFESVNGRTHARTPAQVPYYKLTLSLPLWWAKKFMFNSLKNEISTLDKQRIRVKMQLSFSIYRRDKYKLEDLKVLERSPDLLYNV